MEAPELEPTPTLDPQRPTFTHEQIRRVIIGVMLCIFLGAVDQTVVIPAVPAIASDLHGFGHLAWIVTAYMLTSTIFTPFYGKISDIFGRRALLLPAIGIFLATSVLCGFAQSLWQLILFRALQGIGGAGLVSMAQASIADVVSPRERGRYQAYMTSSWVVASIVGPVLGGWATDALSWRWIFWANAPVCIAAYLLSSRALRMLPVQRRRVKIDTLGSIFLSISTTAFLLVLSWGGGDYAWTSPEVLGAAATCAIFLALLIWQEKRFIDPLIPPRLFRNATYRCGILIVACNCSGLLGFTFLLPLLFQLTRGSDASASGTQIVPFLLSTCVGSIIAGSFGRRYGRLKPVIIGGLVVSFVSSVLFALVGDGAGGAWLAVLQIFTGMGFGVVQPCTMVTIQNASERRDVGAATGTFLFVRNMGGAFGSTFAGVLLAGGFTAELVRKGLAGKVELGTLRQASGAHLALDPVVMQAAHDALNVAFHGAFAACAGLVALAFVATLRMPDVTLRTTT